MLSILGHKIRPYEYVIYLFEQLMRRPSTVTTAVITVIIQLNAFSSK